ncbi:MAG TPA: ABC transporter permease [Tepidisphaeraceae bacterium]|jgi:ABC-type dipeptide/oligopeptide/nickel transport system permease component|nr:ABC transporter permease [Tepidisphaeraceae bacterium]
MLTYITRRILLIFPTLLGMTALVFFVMGMAPGGIGGTMLDRFGNLKSEEAARVREYYQKRYGLDQPLIVQYGRWLNNISPVGTEEREDGTKRFGVKWPSLGESLEQHRPVSELMAERLPITLLLNFISLPLVYAIGVGSGVIAARHRGGWFDRITSTTQLAMWSLPTIWVGVMMIGFLANREYVKWFPTAGMHDMEAGNMLFLPSHDAAGWHLGYVLDGLWHIALPVVCLSLGSSAYLMKLTRGSMLENMGADYSRTARAKGLPERVVIYRHVFRNSLLALITQAATILPAMIGGAVVVESIFSIPGMGQLGVQAVQARDREVVLAVALVGGLIGLLSQLIRDILYAMADPRVSYD